MTLIKNILLNYKQVHFDNDNTANVNENKVTFSKQVTLIEYDKTESIKTERIDIKNIFTETNRITKIERFYKFLDKIKKSYLKLKTNR